MRKLLERLLASLHINGRDLAVFLLSLLLAFSIWIIHNLSLRYNDYLKVSVVAKCNIEGHADRSVNKCDVIARCRARGYTVITSKLREGRKVVEVEFNPSIIKKRSGDFFYISSSDLQEYAHLIFGNDVTIDYFVSDTLQFRFPSVTYKKVPVYPVASLSFHDQYMAKGSIKVDPDSVTIYGEPFKLDNISEVFTRPLNLHDLDSDIQGLVSLETLKGIRCSDKNVRYSIGVTRYVELRGKTVVTASDVPAGRNVLVVPSIVDFSLKCSYPLEGNPLEAFMLKVDYQDVLNSLSGKCVVRPDTLPNGVLDYEAFPEVVQCLVEER